MWRKAPLHAAAKNLSGIVIIEIVCRFLEKLKRELPDTPAIPLQGIYLRGVKLVYQRDISTHMLIKALFIRAKIRNQSRCPSTEQLRKMCDICNRILFSI